MEKQLRAFRFSEEQMEDVNIIVENLSQLGAAYAYKHFGGHGIIEENSVEDYTTLNKKTLEAGLSFAAKTAGIPVPKTTTDMAYALDNTSFRDVINTIQVRSIATMLANYTSPQLDRLVEVDTVEVGGSKTYEIDTKALPIAQRATYGSNITMLPSYAKNSITVTPVPYSIGISLDFIRMVANGYDWGKAIGRVYAGMIYAQYKLAVDKIFSTTALNTTPFYQATFSGSTFTQLASDVSMVSGNNSVLALGTIVAWNAISALATQGGFTTKDEYIRTAYLNKVYGVDAMILDQFTNLSIPFTTANASSLRAIPNNLIVLVPVAADKIVKLVREDYIRVIETPANDNTLNRNEYSYFLSFDAAVATASYYGLQSTTSA